ncbi:MAG: carbamoyltransferase HypF [Methylococcaceae bacterium]|nr:carbamoyltransferase HypF [Methylococcaceae bacterium]
MSAVTLLKILPGIKTAVQHHYAHALACMAEHRLEPPVLGIVWDGSGLGDDQTLWGGEFLLITAQGYQRFGHLRSFVLPGGTKAIMEPRRAALGLLYGIYNDNVFNISDLGFTAEELTLLKSAIKKLINCPQTTSAGRLFDAVASLLGLCPINGYEGQAAMMIENTASCCVTDRFYPFNLNTGKSIVVDWQETFEQIVEDRRLGFSPALIAAKFHNTLAEMMLCVAKLAEQKTIVLSGGCFQNALLVEKAVNSLKNAGFTVYCHEKIPPNDGGLALGQLVAANYLGH